MESPDSTTGGANSTGTRSTSTETNRMNRGGTPSFRPRTNIICRFYLYGWCTKGPSCEFLHDASGLDLDQICRPFLNGDCMSGETCRYIHIKREDRHESPLWARRGLDRQSSAFPDIGAFVSVLNRAGPYRNAVGPVVRAEADSTTATSAFPGSSATSVGVSHQLAPEEKPLCLLYVTGMCRDGEDCDFAHGDMCDLCGKPQLHPTNRRLRKKHRKACLREFKKQENGESAAPARNDPKCSICMEVLHSETASENSSDGRFGLLCNCSHCFCMPCILQWEKSQVDSLGMRRSCPVCRTPYHFITPSQHWVECPEEKAQLIHKHRKALKSQHCLHFKRGDRVCPSDFRCPYLHALPDGRVIQGNVLEVERRPDRPVRREDAPLLHEALPRHIRRMLIDKCPVGLLN